MRAGDCRPAGTGLARLRVSQFGGGERLPNELQSVEPIEPVEVRVVAGTCRRGDEMAKTGRILVGWGGSTNSVEIALPPIPHRADASTK